MKYSIAFLIFFISIIVRPCTNVIVTRNASTDGSNLVSYSADSHDLYGELYHWPAMRYADGTMLDIVEWDTGKHLGQIRQAAQTYAVIGNMNEYQVTIAETTFGGRPELRDSTGILDYGSLMYIALQRSRTAREAIGVMTQLVGEYGYCSAGETFTIADAQEIWLMEMTGKGAGNKGALWVALRVPDGMVTAHANQSRITTFPLHEPEECLYADDVIDYAKDKKWFDGKDKAFSFADAYAPQDFESIRFCEARVWSAYRHLNRQLAETLKDDILQATGKRLPLFIEPENKISHRDVMTIMRDHYEGTELSLSDDVGAGPFGVPYRFRPLTWQVNDTTYFHERAIATQQTGFTFVAQMREWLAAPIGGVLWFGVDDANTTVYVPMYCGITSIPAAYRTGSLIAFDGEAAFWVFNQVAHLGYHRYGVMIDDIRKAQKELEDKFNDYGGAIDQAAHAMYQRSPELARGFLTEYSHMQAQLTVQRWKALYEFLFMKNLDGNLHPEVNGRFLKDPNGRAVPAQHPGYPPSYYEQIVNQHKDQFRLKQP
ncbi:dipeptidase [Breznakibacter xylanolyticus]|uniref:Dipeptidase n=1 Tax=Breznakibacter xylanolyticus TaxID=990 RepID=A0A2W7N5C9_9BACT|nr:C69 family dipeptidase [Breznakibacter xylanolyticus]PZX13527.1 dipeptidase [Breznakibacter xylanolyticus]